MYDEVEYVGEDLFSAKEFFRDLGSQLYDFLKTTAQTKVSHASAILGIYAIMQTTPLTHQVPPQPQIQAGKRKEGEIRYHVEKPGKDLLDRMRYETPLHGSKHRHTRDEGREYQHKEDSVFGNDIAVPYEIADILRERDVAAHRASIQNSIDDRILAVQAARIRRANNIVDQQVPVYEKTEYGSEIVVPPHLLEAYRRAELGEQIGALREARQDERAQEYVFDLSQKVA